MPDRGHLEPLRPQGVEVVPQRSDRQEILSPKCCVGGHVFCVFKHRTVLSERVVCPNDVHRLTVNHLNGLVDDPLVVGDLWVLDVPRLDEDTTPRTENGMPSPQCFRQVEVEVDGIRRDYTVNATLQDLRA